jgi:hypothetical protein
MEQTFDGYPRGDQKAAIFLGTRQGLHSGYENCWMRSDLANACRDAGIVSTKSS